MLAIYKRELKSYFDTMTGWVFIALMMAVIGIYMFVYNFYYGMPYFGYTLYGCEFIFMIFAPIISMRSMAEERKAKTDQLLLTSPVSVPKIVLGKYFAMISILAIALIPFLPVPIILIAAGEGSFLIYYSTMLAFFLIGCVYIGIGMLISSLTESQIISAVGTFVIILVIRLWPALLQFIPASATSSMIGFIIILTLLCIILYYMIKNIIIPVAIEVVGVATIVIFYLINENAFDSGLVTFLSQFDVVTIIANFGNNYIFDVSGLILYISLSALLVFITIQMMQKRRWS